MISVFIDSPNICKIYDQKTILIYAKETMAWAKLSSHCII